MLFCFQLRELSVVSKKKRGFELMGQTLELLGQTLEPLGTNELLGQTLELLGQ